MLVLKPRPDASVVAVVADLVGDERYELRFWDRRKQAFLPALVPLVRNMEWGRSAAGTEEVVVVEMDEPTRRSARVARVDPRTGRRIAEVYASADARAHVDVFRTKDGAQLIVSANTKLASELHALPLAALDAAPRLLWEPRDGVECFAEHHAGAFHLVANEAGSFAVLRADPETRALQTLFHDPDVHVQVSVTLGGG